MFSGHPQGAVLSGGGEVSLATSEDCWEVSGLLRAFGWERVHGAAAVTKMGRTN